MGFFFSAHERRELAFIFVVFGVHRSILVGAKPPGEPCYLRLVGDASPYPLGRRSSQSEGASRIIPAISKIRQASLIFPFSRHDPFGSPRGKARLGCRFSCRR